MHLTTPVIISDGLYSCRNLSLLHSFTNHRNDVHSIIKDNFSEIDINVKNILKIDWFKRSLIKYCIPNFILLFESAISRYKLKVKYIQNELFIECSTLNIVYIFENKSILNCIRHDNCTIDTVITYSF